MQVYGGWFENKDPSSVLEDNVKFIKVNEVTKCSEPCCQPL